MGNYRVLTGVNKGKVLPEYKGDKVADLRRDGDPVYLDDGNLFRHMWYNRSEVERVPGKHAGVYDPEHWGEQDPDAYDRMGFKGDLAWLNLQGFPPHGRHLRDDWSN